MKHLKSNSMMSGSRMKAVRPPGKFTTWMNFWPEKKTLHPKAKGKSGEFS